MDLAVERSMMNLTIGEIRDVLGSFKEGDQETSLSPVMGIDIDSRSIKAGFIFVAVKGKKQDGHGFLESAFANGATAAIISQDQADKRELKGSRFIRVEETIPALGKLASHYRRKFDIPVLTVTGSNGKTTVKNLIFEVLSTAGAVLQSEKNYNNHLGLPLSIFRLTDKHNFAVFELGMSAPGEIARLGEISSPDIAVITNVGPVHMEFFESVDQIADAKIEIAGKLRDNGALIINGDDSLLIEKARGLKRRIIKFGLGDGNDITAENLRFDDNQSPEFSIAGVDIKSNLPGIHNVYNMLAAFAVARELKIDPDLAGKAISRFISKDMRSEIIRKDGITYILDCYNANPVSMKYAIDTLAAMKCDGRRVAVLGDMLELGKDSAKFHHELGVYAKEKGIDAVFCHGAQSAAIVDAFGSEARYSMNKEHLATILSEFMRTGDIVLFKASRGVAIEEIYDAMREGI